jgi:MFS family permease
MRAGAVAESLVERFAHGQERHAQRWHLHLPREGEPAREVRPLIVLLGLPTFGLAMAISLLTTYGPVILIHLTHSPAAVGALIGGEGAFALVVPLASGTVSDRLPPSPLGRRLPFVIAGAPLAATALAVLPFSGSTAIAALSVLVFFIGYYTYYPPYRALYADLLPRSLYARAQAGQAIARGIGLGVALLAGGLLLGVWEPLPFVIGSAVLVAATVALLPVFRLESRCRDSTLPYQVASAVIAVVAIAYVAGAPLAGWLADRYGLLRVLSSASLVYGVGLLLGTFLHTLVPILIGLPFVALAGAIVLTLPQALAFTLAPDGSEGAAAGLLDFSRGVGVVLGPVVVGAVIGLSRSVFTSTDGYASMWLVIAVPVLVAAFLLRRLEPSVRFRIGAETGR